MNKREIAKEVFATKPWLWLITPLLVAFLVGQATMYSRSLTLREVKALDVEITTDLLEETLGKHHQPAQKDKLKRIFNSLTSSQSPEMRLGAAMWIDGVQQEANHKMLRGKSRQDIQKMISEGDRRYSLVEIHPEGVTQKIELCYFRPELAHRMGVVHFLWLSLFQLADEHSVEITGLVFIERLWKLWVLTALFTCIAIFIGRYAFCFHQRKVLEKLDRAHEDYEKLDARRRRNKERYTVVEDELKQQQERRHQLELELKKRNQEVTQARKRQKRTDYALEKSNQKMTEVDEIIKELEVKRLEIEQLKNEVAHRENEAIQIEQEQREKLSQINHYQNKKAAGSHKKIQSNEFKIFFINAFPDFVFKSSSFDVISKFVASSQYENNLELLIKYLSRLHNDREILQSKRLHGSTDAREIKLTGSGHGHYPLRIYFSKTSDKTFVMIGDKANQNEDIKYLRKNFKSTH